MANMKDECDTKPTAATTKLALPKSVFGLETDPKKTPFGLLNGQMRSNSILNNAGWFNLMGEKIGYGDISMGDLEKISNGLNANECFFVLSEFDTVWGMPKDMSANEPGKDYVMKHCAWSVSRSSILKVIDTVPAAKAQSAISSDNVNYIRVGRPAFEKAITTLFYTPKTASKHPKIDNIKTDDIDALVKQNISRVAKLTNATKATYASPGTIGTMPLPNAGVAAYPKNAATSAPAATPAPATHAPAITKPTATTTPTAVP